MPLAWTGAGSGGGLADDRHVHLRWARRNPRGAGRNGAIGISAIDSLIAALVAAPALFTPTNGSRWSSMAGRRCTRTAPNCALWKPSSTATARSRTSSPIGRRPIVRSSWSMTAASSCAIGQSALSSGSGCAPKNGRSTFCSLSTAKCWSVYCEGELDLLPGFAGCGKGTRPPPMKRSPGPSPPIARSVPLVPPKRAGSKVRARSAFGAGAPCRR